MRVARVAVLYILLTLVMTWPLPVRLASDVPGDLGDSLLNMWILGWGAENIPRVLAGQLSWTDFWNANIFHPEPLALTFSEHLFGQVLQMLPVYYVTGNLILAYNLLFLSTFALSGLAVYLLVRELLHDTSRFCWPAFLAGLIYTFVPLRIGQVAHIQSLSSQWMPFALYGFSRYITTARRRPLLWGSAALLMQNWSCGYYLIYFAPCTVLFVAHQIIASGRGREWRTWASFLVAGAAVAAGTWPFLAPYLEARRVHGFTRELSEVIRFSADVFGYVTAPEALRVWGELQTYPKPEGALFMGAVPWLLAACAAAGAIHTKSASSARATRPVSGFVARALVLIAVLQGAAFVAVIVSGGFVWQIVGVPLRATDARRVLLGLVVTVVLIVATSSTARHRVRAWARSPAGLALALMTLAIWLSLGPQPHSLGRRLEGLGLYSAFYHYVPGFDGLRVPARYSMVAALFLSVVAAYGAAALLARTSRRAVLGALLAGAILVETAFLPIQVNQTWAETGAMPPARVEPAATAPPVYRRLAALTDARVIAEFPFGDPAWELRYVYYSTVHWKRLVNGYSGGFPQRYKVRVALLQQPHVNPDAAWAALRDAGTTHVVLHESAYLSRDEMVDTARWLRSHGAQVVATDGDDVLYAMPE